MDFDNDVYEELVETTQEEESEPTIDTPAAPAGQLLYYTVIPLNIIKRS